MKRTRKRQSSASPHKSPSIQVLRAVSDVVDDKATAQRILNLEAQNNELRRAIAQLGEQLTRALPSLSESPELSPSPGHPNRVVTDPEIKQPAIELSSPPALNKPSRGKISTNAIGQLQEIAQEAKVKLPSYEPRGSHTNFECVCRFKFIGEHHLAKGGGLNKNAAKIDAAVKMLNRLGYTS